MLTPTSPRYCDFYGLMSYKDFLIAVAAGTLDMSDIISLGEDKP